MRVREPSAQSWSDRASVVCEVGPRSYVIRRNRKHLKLIPNHEDVMSRIPEPVSVDKPDQTRVSDFADADDDDGNRATTPVLQPDHTRSGRTIVKPKRLIEQC